MKADGIVPPLYQLYQLEVFSSGEQTIPVNMYKTLSGPQIWICFTCHHLIMCNTTSVQCTVCNNWCHLKRCSDLNSHRDWFADFVASCCSPQSQNFSTTPLSTFTQSSVHSPPIGQVRKFSIDVFRCFQINIKPVQCMAVRTCTT